MEKVASIAVAENLLSQKSVAERVHTAYGMSKDFGMSGFRVGCLHTRNKDMQKVRWSEVSIMGLSNLCLYFRMLKSLCFVFCALISVSINL